MADWWWWWWWGGLLVHVVFQLWLCLSVVWLFHIRYHGCFGLSSFIKGSGVSESLWCFLSRGGSTLLQRVHEGERMYPPLGSIGWWEPGDQAHNNLLPEGVHPLDRDAYGNIHRKIPLHTRHVQQSLNLKTLLFWCLVTLIYTQELAFLLASLCLRFFLQLCFRPLGGDVQHTRKQSQSDKRAARSALSCNQSSVRSLT